jgi:hypothetical protein
MPRSTEHIRMTRTPLISRCLGTAESRLFLGLTKRVCFFAFPVKDTPLPAQVAYKLGPFHTLTRSFLL